MWYFYKGMLMNFNYLCVAVVMYFLYTVIYHYIRDNSKYLK